MSSGHGHDAPLTPVGGGQPNTTLDNGGDVMNARLFHPEQKAPKKKGLSLTTIIMVAVVVVALAIGGLFMHRESQSSQHSAAATATATD